MENTIRAQHCCGLIPPYCEQILQKKITIFDQPVSDLVRISNQTRPGQSGKR